MAAADRNEIAQQIRTFGQNLRSARRLAGFTQARLSSCAQLDRAAISRLECGERAPDLPTLLRLCQALQVAPMDLLHGVGTDNPTPFRTTGENGVVRNPAIVFGENLRWARVRAGISQERLALDSKVDRAAISVYENGGRQPNLRTILKLAWKLEMRPASLLWGIGARADGSTGVKTR